MPTTGTRSGRASRPRPDVRGRKPTANTLAPVKGTVVHQVREAVYELITDPATGQTSTVVVAPPTYEPISATVTAHALDPDAGAGASLCSVRTDKCGRFVIRGMTGDICVEVAPTSTEWQGGWVWSQFKPDDGRFASYLQPRAGICAISQDSELGFLRLMPAVARGRVVDLVTGAPIVGAEVRYEPVGPYRVVATKTDGSGSFRLAGLDVDEYAINVSATNYAGGFLGGDFLLHAEPGDACTHAPGTLPADVRMAPLEQSPDLGRATEAYWQEWTPPDPQPHVGYDAELHLPPGAYVLNAAAGVRLHGDAISDSAIECSLFVGSQNVSLNHHRLAPGHGHSIAAVSHTDSADPTVIQWVCSSTAGPFDLHLAVTATKVARLHHIG